MRRQIISEASVHCGLAVWLAAALLLPFHLGAAGAGLRGLAAYLLLAGLLISVGDVLAGTGLWRGTRDFVSSALMRSLGLAVPAAAIFLVAQALAPAAEALEDEVCALGGYAEAPDGAGVSADRVIDGNADCAPEAD